MHLRRISKRTVPASAVNLEQLLFMANGIVGLMNSILNLGNSGIGFYERVLGLDKSAR